MANPICYEFGEFRLDPASRELWQGDQIIALPFRAFDCLLFLIEQRDRAVSRDELVSAIWGRVDVSDAQLGQIVLHARRAVGDDGNAQNMIRTIPRFGYRWVADTREVPSSAQPPAPKRGAQVGVSTVPDEQERPRRRLLVMALALAMLLISALLLIPGTRDSVQPTRGGTLVLPVSVDASSEHAWLRLGGMDFIAGRLRAAGVPVPASESMLSILEANSGEDGDAERLRRVTDADMVVAVHAQATESGWQLQLTVPRRQGPTLAFQAGADDPLEALRQAGDRLLAEIGHVPLPSDGNLELEEILQRAQAALLGNQLEAARAIFADAPEELRSDPRLRYHLALVDVRAGRWPEVRDAMQAMLDDGRGGYDGLLHGQILTTLGVAHFNLDDRAAAGEYADAAIALLTDAGDPAELGRALGLRAGARSAQQRYDEAFEDFGNARAQLGRAGDRLAMARLDQLMGSVELMRARLQQARALIERAVVELESLGAVNERIYGLSLLVRVEMAEMDYHRALAASNRAWALRPRVPDPETRYVMAIDRARVLEAQGRLDEAQALLDALAAEPSPPNPWALSLSDWAYARLAQAGGNHERAAQLAEAALERLLPSEQQRMTASLAMLRQRALLALGRHDQAASALAAFDAQRQFDPRSDPVELLVARAELAAATGQNAAADELFRAAVSKAEDQAVPQELVLAGVAYGRYLLVHDRLPEAGAVAGRISPWAEQDYDCALLQAAFYQAAGPRSAWVRTLDQARALAGQRELPAELEAEPPQLRLGPAE